MLNGASQVIGGVRGVHIDPFVLVESQLHDTVGFIMIVYKKPEKMFDILFLRGPAIIASERLTADRRSPIEVASVRSEFSRNRRASLVYLFLCPPQEIKRFMATLHMQPCLKIPIDPVQRKRIRLLIKSTGCRNGILEQNVFLTDPPKIDLVDFNVLEYVPAAPKIRFNGGHLLLYDLEKSHGLKVGEPVSPHVAPEQKEESLVKQSSPDPASVEKTPAGQSENPGVSSEPGETCEPPAANTIPSVEPEADTSSEPSVGEDDQKYVRTFQKLFRSFKQEAFECFGRKWEAVMADAIQEARLLNSEFDIEDLTDTTAPFVLDIMADMINRAPFLKRSKLRETALTLVADLYNKHYELLEQNNAIDKVEQNYFQLKK